MYSFLFSLFWGVLTPPITC
uniref:Uncharacterized protein n=1 Tax=Anguilla anguilla TaxID=7936 RepID=A0A0E9UNH9_ANGAN